MPIGQFGGLFVIDGREPVSGTLSITQEYETIYSDRAAKPDPAWRFVDAAGHFHANDAGGKPITLTSRRRHVDCDGSCGGVCDGEGYDELDYFCAICNERIGPGHVPDSGPRSVPGPRSWQVEVTTPTGDGWLLVAGIMVSVRTVDDAHTTTLFGVAEVGEMTYRRGTGVSQMTALLHGRGVLGSCPAVPLAVR